ncbi:sensor histidine kinase [Hahella ganghwensis]|uniref:sensor histidine kinase n=1 Tax=Hahella ganghwensis TaxID=286420 RepID=UPI00036041B3|nr:HAMP domain-containing sensor histidine kinase [Hahella ganghwensis]
MKLPKIFRNSAFQLALLYTFLFAASVLFLLGFIYWATVGFMSDQVDETIQAEIQGLAEQYRRQGLRGMVSVMNERVLNDPQGESIYLLVNNEFQPQAGNLNEWPALVEDDDGWISFYLNRSGGRFSAPHMARARVFTLRGGYRLLVGRDVFALFRVRELIERSLTWGVGITLAMAFLGGVALSKSTRRRIEAITHTSRQIMQGNLSLRVPTRGTGDDFDELAEHLNRMLDQIEGLMAGVRHVSDNIAHDLRTPLTRMRGRLELLQSKDLEEDSRMIVQEVIAEADHLLVTFNALLRIARIESGGYSGKFDDVDLYELVVDAVDLYEAVASDKSQHLSLDLAKGITTKGDRDLLFQAIANLLDNAIKYTPEGGNVGVRLRAFDNAVISVWDEGPGIVEEEREKVLERFYRVDKTRGLPGNGLGLSMVKAVSEMHKGHLLLKDNQPGLRAELHLPLIRIQKQSSSGQDQKSGQASLPGPETTA